MAIERLKPILSLDEERVRALEHVVPEAFADGYINWEILRELLGERVEDEDAGAEHFGLFWPGKRDARRLAAQPSKWTLVPAPGEGVDEEITGNIFIEGDNLEVLKLLQKSYSRSIKLVYIDPPYNTGQDLIYKDNYTEPLEDYLKQTNQLDDAGRLVTTNTKAQGRFHTNWLNMMFPRLILARNLLRDDGFFVVSIDDEEFANLRLLLDQVFGEENRLAILVWDRNRKNDAKYFSVGHEYMVVYAKDEQKLKDSDIRLRAPKEGLDDVRAEVERLRLQHADNWKRVEDGLREFFSKMSEDDPRLPLARYSKVDERGPYRTDGNPSWPGGGGPRYEVLHPKTGKPCKIPSRGWVWPTYQRMKEIIDQGNIVFGPDETSIPSVRMNLFEKDKQVMRSVMFSYAQKAAQDFADIFDGVKVFDNPKSYVDIAAIVSYLTQPGDIVLDFFAGSGTTAHAVMSVNGRDGGARRFLCVQLPEPISHKTSTGQNALFVGLKTIAEITKERIRRSAISLKQQSKHNLKLQYAEEDYGFRVFKLERSNFRTWQDYRGDEIRELEMLFANGESPFMDGWEELNVLTELLLTQGFPPHV